MVWLCQDLRFSQSIKRGTSRVEQFRVMSGHLPQVDEDLNACARGRFIGGGWVAAPLAKGRRMGDKTKGTERTEGTDQGERTR